MIVKTYLISYNDDKIGRHKYHWQNTPHFICVTCFYAFLQWRLYELNGRLFISTCWCWQLPCLFWQKLGDNCITTHLITVSVRNFRGIEQSVPVAINHVNEGHGDVTICTYFLRYWILWGKSTHSWRAIFPHKSLVMWSFYVLFGIHLNKLYEQTIGFQVNTQATSL